MRFKNASGQIYYGEAQDISEITKETLIGAKVLVYRGEEPWDSDFKLTDQTETISEVRLSRLWRNCIIE